MMNLKTNLTTILADVKHKILPATRCTEAQTLEHEYDSVCKKIVAEYECRNSRLLTCKTEDDTHFDNCTEQINALYVLQSRIDDTIVCMINTFPIDTPCTAEVVSARTGVRMETLNRVMMSRWTSDELETNIDNVRCTIYDIIYPYYSHHKYIIYNIDTMKLPNWKFVLDDRRCDSEYIERIE